MQYLWDPLLSHILKGRGRDDGEADEEDVRLRVREGPQAVVVLLAGCVKEPEGVLLIANVDSSGVVVKDRRDVLGGELVRRVGDEQTGLAHGSVPHDDQLDGLHAASLSVRACEWMRRRGRL